MSRSGLLSPAPAGRRPPTATRSAVVRSAAAPDKAALEPAQGSRTQPTLTGQHRGLPTEATGAARRSGSYSSGSRPPRRSSRSTSRSSPPRSAHGDRRARAGEPRAADRERAGGRRLHAQQVHQPGALRAGWSARSPASTSRATSSPTTWPSGPSGASATSWGCDDSSFIQFGYWDSLKKGLLAGERLHLDLQRMEAAYLEQNRREYEITKHVSLAAARPDGAAPAASRPASCDVDLPEALFDLDYPGHYMRRIKSVSLTIPCVTGPYTGVNCTLTLLQQRSAPTPARRRTTPTDTCRTTMPASRHQSAPSSRSSPAAARTTAACSSSTSATSATCPSRAPARSAAGASSCRNYTPFDYDTISDVILHVRYTARDGGEPAATESARRGRRRAKPRWPHQAV